MVCTEFNEVDQIRTDLFIDGAQIAGDVDAPASAIRIMKCVVIKKRMKRVLLEE